MAKKRVAFRRHFCTYLLVNVFIWTLWFLDGADALHQGLPWPAWVSFGWGIGIGFNYYDAYYSAYDDATTREYEKLVRRKNL